MCDNVCLCNFLSRLACRKGRLFESRGLSLQVVLPGNQVSACAVGQDGGLLFTTTPRKVKESSNLDQMHMQNSGFDICMEVKVLKGDKISCLCIFA